MQLLLFRVQDTQPGLHGTQIPVSGLSTKPVRHWHPSETFIAAGWTHCRQTPNASHSRHFGSQ